jgi:hypothetical protein
VPQVFSFHGRLLLEIPARCKLSSLGGDPRDKTKTEGGESSRTKPTRRRRSGPYSNRISERDRFEEAESEIRDVSPKEFSSCSIQLLDKLYQRCLPLRKINDNMNVVKGDSCIDKDAKFLGIESNDSLMDGPYLLVDVGPVDGRYVLIADMGRRLVLFQSPISGHLLYEYHSRTKTWMNVQDGHNLEGIFVRDLCRKIKGYPNL